MTKPKWQDYFTLQTVFDYDGAFSHYFFAWKGSNRPVWHHDIWGSKINAEAWILKQDWQAKLDEEFEKEVLGGS